jgi:uncharacterized protein (TIGR02145 family)
MISCFYPVTRAQEFVTDIDGNIYPTIIIGEQQWMAENLRVTRYTNGDSILAGQDDLTWQGASEGMWASYNNDESNDILYGKLYNWYVVADTRNVCPDGWRVPTNNDWKQLMDSIDGAAWGNNNLLGNKLKSRLQYDSPLGQPWDTDEHPRWDSHPRRFGTDDYGFSALPAGGKDPFEGFLNRGTHAYFWSSTSNSATHAWMRTFIFSHKGVSQSAYQKNRGLSVRCVFGEPVVEYSNSMTITNGSGQPAETLIFEVALENEQEITGFQIDFLLPDGFQYVNNSFQLTERGQDHSVSAVILPGNKLRLIAESASDLSFSGTSGTLFSFFLNSPAAEGDWILESEKVTITNNLGQSLNLDQLQASVTLTQGDKEFWLVVPKITQGHSWSGRRFFIRLTNSGFPSNVKISMPANDSFEPIMFQMQPNEARTVDITDDIEAFWVENPNMIYNNGVLIESGSPTSAYFEVGTHNNPDIFTLKGKNALGRDFFVPFQTIYDNYNGYTPSPYSAIYIVATENNTLVTITPSKAAHPGRLPQTAFNVILNKGQTFAVAPDDYTEAGQLAENRLAGTRVQASKPIAIMTSDDSIGPSCRDLVGDQLVPVSSVGSEYITMKGRLNIPEYFYVLATDDQQPTQIFVDGVQVSEIVAGEQYQYQFTNNNHHVTTSAPAYVYHVSGFGCEMGGAVIPPVDTNTGSTTVSFTRSKAESFFLNILVKAGAEDGFVLTTGADKQEVEIDPENFSAVPGAEEWLVGEFQFSSTSVIPVNVPSLLRNTKDVFHLGIINGGSSSGTMYGYFSAFRTFPAKVLYSD